MNCMPCLEALSAWPGKRCIVQRVAAESLQGHEAHSWYMTDCTARSKLGTVQEVGAPWHPATDECADCHSHAFITAPDAPVNPILYWVGRREGDTFALDQAKGPYRHALSFPSPWHECDQRCCRVRSTPFRTLRDCRLDATRVACPATRLGMTNLHALGCTQPAWTGPARGSLGSCQCTQVGPRQCGLCYQRLPGPTERAGHCLGLAARERPALRG